MLEVRCWQRERVLTSFGVDDGQCLGLFRRQGKEGHDEVKVAVAITVDDFVMHLLPGRDFLFSWTF